MIYSVELSEEAKEDMLQIFRYIAFDLCAAESAAALLDRIEQRISGLSQMPERFRRYDRSPWRERGMRMMPVENYCVFYIPDHSAKTVTILRVLYAGRDIDALLRDAVSPNL